MNRENPLSKQAIRRTRTLGAAVPILVLSIFWAIIPVWAADSGCKPTPADALGPFYKAGAPQRGEVGAGYRLTGAVASAAGCRPLPGATVELWMAGPDGVYGDEFRATILTDGEGRYAFSSHRPVPYAGRPPHIHLRVSAPGHQTLATQHYPRGDARDAVMDIVLRPDGN